MHPRVIASAIGFVVAAGGVAMLVPAIYSLFVPDGTTIAFWIPALAAIAGGTAVFFVTRITDSYVSAQDVSL